MDEFEHIARHLAPLAGEGALGLKDDVGLIGGYAVTKDVIVQGTHFLASDPLDSVAWKAVAVNASDLIAKGCRPGAVMLGCVWNDPGEAMLAAFAAGLGEALRAYDCVLLGGDTTRDAGPPPGRMMVSVTMMGRPIGEGIVPRSGARAGDALYVGGAIGEGHAGLQAALGQADLGQAAVGAYRRPAPPLALADVIARHAGASIDVSDGLLADAGHLAASSGVRAVIEHAAVPLGPAARAWAEATGDRGAALTGGDDYVPLCAVRPENETAFRAQAEAAGVAVTRIGACGPGDGVALQAEDGARQVIEGGGFLHF